MSEAPIKTVTPPDVAAAPAAATPAPVRHRASKPIARSLTALAEIAAALATQSSVAAVVPGILTTVAGELDGADATLWLRGADGLRRAWSVGADHTEGNDVEAQLRDGEHSGTACFVAARLFARGQELGALSVRPGRVLSPDDRLFLATVADLVAPALGAEEYTTRLESEVASRTREIDEQRSFIENIVDSLPVGLYVIDRAYRIKAWNRKRETGLQGVSREEAIGRTIFEILHRQPAEVLRNEFETVFATGEMQQFSIESTAFGEARTYRLSKIPMRMGDDQQVTHIITIGEDITEWRQAEARFAQAEKLAAIGTLAAGVMHEINNPLATIGACAEGLAAELAERQVELPRDEARVIEALDVVQHEVQRCKGIVDGLLDFSRPKAMMKDLVDLNAVVDKTLRLVKHHPRFRRATVGVEACRDVRLVRANEEQIVQVLMALLVNALDAMGDAGVVTLRTLSEPGASIVEVIDAGPGVRLADRDKIFEPFYTTKSPSRGTGLGLSVCYAIVMEHGGQIEVDSPAAGGSVFRIILPTPAA